MSPLSGDTGLLLKEWPPGTEKILSMKVENRGGDPELRTPQRNTGENPGGLPEWEFESTSPDLKELGNRRGHVDYTTEIQQSSFFG